MQVLILGNGFDIYHCLPTTYYCFLKVTGFLIHGKDTDRNRMRIIGDKNLGMILNEVGKSCELINKSYTEYKKEYDSLFIDERDLDKICTACQENPWWNFFVELCQDDVGWIDVETKIHFLIEELYSLLNNKDAWIIRDKTFFLKDKFVSKSLFRFINCFCEPKYDFDLSQNFGYYGEGNRPHVIDKYILSNEIDIEKGHINVKAIIDLLFEKLMGFSNILVFYLSHFVEQVTEKRIETGQLVDYNDFFNQFDNIISFNYTRTYEKQYKGSVIDHIHGTVDNKIVLGINPDGNDQKGSNAELISFKKYYQRLWYDTVTSFRETLFKMRRNYENIAKNYVSVLGHSLDITDEDIIRRVFSFAHSITIYCHNSDVQKTYLQNLVKIFGNDGLENLFYEKQLVFKNIKEIGGQS